MTEREGAFGQNTSIASADVSSNRQRTGSAKPSRSASRQIIRLDSRNILLLLLGFRLLNALTVRTFFQPDEYFQALEPAWLWAFGRDSGAWITWVGLEVHFGGAGCSPPAGMETPSAVGNPSGNIRSCLQARRYGRGFHHLRSSLSIRAPSGCAENHSGRPFRSVRLLHMETRVLAVWGRLYRSILHGHFDHP
jgi:hypothetical protein